MTDRCGAPAPDSWIIPFGTTCQLDANHEGDHHDEESGAWWGNPLTDTDRSTTMTDQTIPVEKLRALLDGEGSAADKIQAIYDDLLPPVLPDPLFGAWATHPDHGEGVVTSHHPDGDGEVRFMSPEESSNDGTLGHWVSPSTLTFHTPDHPVFLKSEEDYENAPAVASSGGGWPA